MHFWKLLVVRVNVWSKEEQDPQRARASHSLMETKGNRQREDPKNHLPCTP